MKFAKDIFPKGTFPKQQTDGAYISEFLGRNLDIYAKKIVKDMHFLGIVTGHDSVGNGKSTMATHLGSYLTNKINELHGTDNTFTHRNMVFNSKELVTRSFELKKYSVIILDEGDDLTTHGMKDMAVRLKRYFRKTRQLNQIIILILPSFFELPKFYALSRSHFLIDVKFEGEFERGFFKFYGPTAKKILYLKGKKEWNYEVCRPDFDGRFFSNYCFFPDVERCTRIYKEKKYSDMLDDAKEEEESMTRAQIEQRVKLQILRGFRENCPEIFMRDIVRGFGISEATAFRWLKG